MRTAVVSDPDEGVTITERERPEPGTGEVRIAVAACGVCGGDRAVLDGEAGIDYPRIPGHEIAGRVDAVGEDVEQWSVGDRVAVGWHGGHCFTCTECRHGNFTTCEHKQVTGMTRHGGFAEYTLASAEAMAEVPEGVDFVDAAPLVCAGLTPYNALRNSAARPGDLVAVQGVGGVGHLGVQFADAMGYETVALSRGTGKQATAHNLGADGFVDTTATDPAEALQERGGADAVLATAPNANAMESVVDGLAPNGELLLVGAPAEPVELAVGPLLNGRRSVRGWSAGHSGDARDTLEMAVSRGIAPLTETYPLADVEQAIARMTEGEARFRAVVTP